MHSPRAVCATVVGSLLLIPMIAAGQGGARAGARNVPGLEARPTWQLVSEHCVQIAADPRASSE